MCDKERLDHIGQIRVSKGTLEGDGESKQSYGEWDLIHMHRSLGFLYELGKGEEELLEFLGRVKVPRYGTRLFRRAGIKDENSKFSGSCMFS